MILTQEEREQTRAAYIDGCKLLRLEYETNGLYKLSFFRWRVAYRTRLTDLHYQGICSPECTAAFNGLDLRKPVSDEQRRQYLRGRMKDAQVQWALYDGLLHGDTVQKGVGFDAIR